MLFLINILLALWVSCAEGQERTCNFPEIKHGKLYGENQPKQNFQVAVGKYFYYTCDHSYVSASQSLWTRITCTEEGWLPIPKCRRLCFFPSVENGHSSSSGQIHMEGDTVQILCDMGYILANYQSNITCTEDDWSSPPTCNPAEISCKLPEITNGYAISPDKIYKKNEQFHYTCNQGFEYSERGYAVCTRNGWNPSPSCKEVTCDPPYIENGFYMPQKITHRIGDKITYTCKTGFSPETRRKTAVCTSGGWSPMPRCSLSTVQCGPPPPIENGDLTSFPLSEYAPGSSVEYQCQALYELQGSKHITCNNGQWSEPPKCLDACVVSKEMMEKHNIKLKWADVNKIYAKTDDTVEFTCKWGYVPKTPRENFRATCHEGKLEYPSCESHFV